MSFTLLAMILSVAVSIMPAAAGGRAEEAAQTTEASATPELTVESGWIRAGIPGDENGAGYLTLRNQGAAAARLTAVRGTVSRRVELHTHARVDGLLRMVEVPFIEVPAGGEVSMAPGGLHIMFMGLNAPFVVGDRHTLTLQFDDGRSVDVSVEVLPITTRARQPFSDQP